MAHKTLQLIRRLVIVRLAWSIDRRSRIGVRDGDRIQVGEIRTFVPTAVYIIRNIYRTHTFLENVATRATRRDHTRYHDRLLTPTNKTEGIDLTHISLLALRPKKR